MKIFDFDGTLVVDNTPDLLLQELSKFKWRYWLVYSLLYSSLGTRLFRFFRAKNSRKVFCINMSFIKEADFTQACENVARRVKLIPAVVNELNDACVIVSASFDKIIKNVFPNTTVITNSIRVVGGYCWIVDRDCIGAEKVRRLKELYDIGNLEEAIFYTDSSMDLPLIKLCGESYIVENENITRYEEGYFT